MINAKEHLVAWTLLITELDEAREHLEKLTNDMNSQSPMDESEFAVHLGHVFAHLNRAWHSRNQTSSITNEQWTPFSQFPTDLQPVG